MMFATDVDQRTTLATSAGAKSGGDKSKSVRLPKVDMD